MVDLQFQARTTTVESLVVARNSKYCFMDLIDKTHMKLPVSKSTKSSNPSDYSPKVFEDVPDTVLKLPANFVSGVCVAIAEIMLKQRPSEVLIPWMRYTTYQKFKNLHFIHKDTITRPTASRVHISRVSHTMCLVTVNMNISNTMTDTFMLTLIAERGKWIILEFDSLEKYTKEAKDARTSSQITKFV